MGAKKMKFHAKVTSYGLTPISDDDFDAKSKLKTGAVYEVSVRQARNYEFHKKYFALIRCSWEYLNESQEAFFKTIEVFRKTMEVASGHCDRIYSIKRNDWVDVPKSVAFDKMTAVEFEVLYDNVKRVIFSTALRKISEEEFMKNLVNF